MLQLLDGIKVIDCASFVAGPAAATIMADFGADVVKIEPPGIGDTYRNSRGAPGSPPSDYNYAWNLDNRSKRGIELDLKNPAGREVLDRLVADADVLTMTATVPSNFIAGAFNFDERPFFQKTSDEAANVPLVNLGTVE